jgi:hypothetical protein
VNSGLGEPSPFNSRPIIISRCQTQWAKFWRSCPNRETEAWLGQFGNPTRKRFFSDIESDLPQFLREAEGEDIVFTSRGKPSGVLIGFASEDDWLD